MSDIIVGEVRDAVAEMKTRKSPGEDGVPVEARRWRLNILSAIATSFIQCWQWGKVSHKYGKMQ